MEATIAGLAATRNGCVSNDGSGHQHCLRSGERCCKSVLKSASSAAVNALPLSEQQALRFVILPQAVRNVLAPLLNDFVSLQKDVVLISILGTAGLAARQAQIYQSLDFNYTPLVAAAVLYLAVTIPLARIVDRLGYAGGARI